MCPQFSFIVHQCDLNSMPNFPWIFCVILQSPAWKLKKMNVDTSLPLFIYLFIIFLFSSLCNNPPSLWGNIDGTDRLKI